MRSLFRNPYNRFGQNVLDTGKDCTQCADLKDYDACTCDPDSSSAQAPDQERCTFVLGNEDAPAQNAAPAWSEYATSNTVRAGEGARAEKRAKQKQRKLGTSVLPVEMPQEDGDGDGEAAEEADEGLEQDCRGPNCGVWSQSTRACSNLDGDEKAACLSQVSQHVIRWNQSVCDGLTGDDKLVCLSSQEQDVECEDPNDVRCADPWSQQVKGGEMSHGDSLNPVDWDETKQDVFGKGGAGSTCFGPDGPMDECI